MFTNEQLAVLANSANYEKYPLQFLRLSKLNNDIIAVISKKQKTKTAHIC